MEKPALNQYPIHNLLKQRWSPRAFSAQSIETEKLLSLFEAARWSPSAGNSQPWAFIVVTRDDTTTHSKFLEILTGRNPLWASQAPVLVLTLAQREYQPGRPNVWSYYDLGQSVAHLSVEAGDLGLSVHQMAGFDRDKARELFDIPASYDPVTVIALGYQGQADNLPEALREVELANRARKPLTDFVFEGRWQEPLHLEPVPQAEAAVA